MLQIHSDKERKLKAIEDDSSEVSRLRRIEDEILALIRHNATKNINYGIFHHIHHFPIIGALVGLVGQGTTKFGMSLY